MTFAELITELKARGFDYLSDTRAGRYINWGRAELDEMFLWPYREASGQGAAPLTVSDLGTIEMVTNETVGTVLQPVSYQTLLDGGADLSQSGTPTSYYVAWPAGVPVVATYPSNSDTIGVQYYKITPDLTGVQEPAAPSRFHGLIVDLAVRRAYRDSDNHRAAEELQVDIDRQLLVMVNGLLGGQQIQGPSEHMQVTGESVDW